MCIKVHFRGCQCPSTLQTSTYVVGFISELKPPVSMQSRVQFSSLSENKYSYTRRPKCPHSIYTAVRYVRNIQFRLAGYPAVFTIKFRFQIRPNCWKAPDSTTGYFTVTITVCTIVQNCCKGRSNSIDSHRNCYTKFVFKRLVTQQSF